MKTITESELQASAKRGEVERLNLLKQSSGDWQIDVLIRGIGEPARLITQRKHPRSWSSLHRLVRHAEANYCPSDLLFEFRT